MMLGWRCRAQISIREEMETRRKGEGGPGIQRKGMCCAESLH